MTLYEAALNGDVDALQTLLRGSRGTNRIDAVHKDATVLGERVVAIRHGTPLMAAAGGGHREAAAFLLDYGADVNRQEEHGFTPLILAAMLGHDDVLALLIERGADLNLRDRTGSTPLHYAVTMLRFECAERLVRAGANVGIADHYFKPALHHAVEQWKFAVVRDSRESEERLAKVLNKSVAALRAEKKQRKQALERLIDLLLDSGADLHGRGLVGATPLHVAAEADDIAMARRLIARGADVNRLDDHSRNGCFDSARTSAA